MPIFRMKQAVLLTTLAAVLVTAAGCELIAFVAPRETTYDVDALYRGLDDQDVAVIVAADEYTLFRYPKAPEYVCKAVTSSLQGTVPGVTMTDPKQVVQYQKDHPYWTTQRYSEVAKDLGVTRLVIIDLAEYRTQEPGNAYLWRGVITGNVSVVEADGRDPDDLGFSQDVTARFPEEGEIDEIDGDDETMQLGMLKLFARNVARLFHDHQQTI